jgi:hypothetical protein
LANSESAAQGETIGAAATTTALSVSTASSIVGQQVTYTATVG